MSRRRASYMTTDGVTPDELLDMLYGQRTYHERPMPGCQAVCCEPGAVIDGEAALWPDQALGWALGSETAALAVALLIGLWRLLWT